MGTSGMATTSTSPTGVVDLASGAVFPAFATGVGDSGTDVAHAAMPRKIAATTYRRFMVPPGNQLPGALALVVVSLIDRTVHDAHVAVKYAK
jgi:hypothetical protein